MYHVKQFVIIYNNVPRETMQNVPRETMQNKCSTLNNAQRQQLGRQGAEKGFGGSFPLRSARLRLLRASAAAFRFGRRGFGCFGLRRQLSASVGAASAASGFVGRGSLQLLGLRLLFAPGLARLRSAVGSSALLRPRPPSFASPSQSLRLPSPSSLPLSRAATPSAAFATASLRYKQPPSPSAAFATAFLSYKQPPSLLPPAAQAAAFVHCFTWNIYSALFHVEHFALFHVEHFALFHVEHYCILLQIVSRGTL